MNLRELKLISYTNKVIIYDYQKIINISENEIIVKGLKVLGNKLKIKQLNDYEIYIQGQITKVEYLYDE